MDPFVIADALDALSDDETARRQRKQHQPLRGIRGTPLGEVARIGAAAQSDDPPALPADEGALSELYAGAWEDGLVAIGLLAASIPDNAEVALDIGLRWLDRVDDLATADALGWLVLGGASLASGEPLASLPMPGHDAAKRAIAMAAMAALPVPVEGPSAAPLRARLGERRVQWVTSAQSAALHEHLHRWLRVESPAVRKALRRILRTWTQTDPEDVVAWADSVRGGLPKLLRAETDRARRRARSPRRS